MMNPRPPIRRRTYFAISAGILFLVIYFTFNYWMVSSVKETLHTLYLHPERDEQLVNKQITPAALKQIHRSKIYSTSAKSHTFSTSAGYGFHYFTGGRIWIKYTYIGRDEGSQKVKYGSSNVATTLKVKLVRGNWKIVHKFEEA